MATPGQTLSDRIPFLRRLARADEPAAERSPQPDASFMTVSHDGQFFVERTSDAGVSYTGPFSSYDEARPVVHGLQSGEIEWSNLTIRTELPAFDRWPQRFGSHRIDVDRRDGQFRVRVEKPPQPIIEGGERHFEPGFRAMSTELYASEAEARLAATQTLLDLQQRGQIAESAFDVEEIERSSTRAPSPGAPVQSDEYRQGLAQGRSSETPGKRPFQLRDVMPERTDPYFRVHSQDDRHYVLFDGNIRMASTPQQVSREKAESMARELNALQKRGVRIDFKGYGFGRNRPSDRRVFIVDQDGQSRVYFNANRKLGRSAAMPRDQAEELREELARQLRTGAPVDWDKADISWGHHPDRLQIRPAEAGDGYRMVYEFRDQAGVSDTLFRTESDANQALDKARRQLFDGERIDMKSWDFRRTARSLELRVREGEGQRFHIATGTGRVYYRPFRDFAEAEAVKAELEGRIAQDGYLPEGGEWLWPNQMSQAQLSHTTGSEIERLGAAIQGRDDAAWQILDEATSAFTGDLDRVLEKLSAAETSQLIRRLEQFGEVKGLNQQLRDVQQSLRRPELQEPVFDPGSRTIRLGLEDDRRALEDKLAALPTEGKLAGEIARQLRARPIDPAAHAVMIENPVVRRHARELLEKYQLVQREYLPRALALGLASQRIGKSVPIQLLGEEASRWLGTMKNLAPSPYVGVLTSVGKAVRAAQQVASPEQTVGHTQ